MTVAALRSSIFLVAMLMYCANNALGFAVKQVHPAVRHCPRSEMAKAEAKMGGMGIILGRSRSWFSGVLLTGVKRYGPGSSSDSGDPFLNARQWEAEQSDVKEEQAACFKSMVSDLRAAVEDSAEGVDIDLAGPVGGKLNGIISNNLHVLLTMRGPIGVEIMRRCIEEDAAEDNLTPLLVDYTIDFLETFVEEAAEADDENKRLLMEIMKAAGAGKHDDRSVANSALDEYLKENKARFSSGFLKHLDGEVQRLRNLPGASPQTAKMMELLRVIQIRVLDEIGSDFGDAATVLSQLLQYDDVELRNKVILPGLEVRGPEFATEMLKLVEEALASVAEDDGGLAVNLKQVKDTLVGYLNDPANDETTKS